MKPIPPTPAELDAGSLESAVEREADALFLSGETPTVRKVRDRLGRGSFTALAPALRLWRAKRGFDRTPAENQTASVPPEVLIAASQLYAAAFHALRERAEATDSDAIEELKAEQAAHRATKLALEHAERELAALRQERTALYEAGARTHDALVQAQALAKHAVSQQLALGEELKATRTRIGELENARARRSPARVKSSRPKPRPPTKVRPKTTRRETRATSRTNRARRRGG